MKVLDDNSTNEEMSKPTVKVWKVDNMKGISKPIVKVRKVDNTEGGNIKTHGESLKNW